MRNIVITNQLLADYYDSQFANDFNRYFKIEDVDGLKVIKSVRLRGDGFLTAASPIKRNMPTPAAMTVTNPDLLDKKTNTLPNETGEEEIMFIALVLFLHSVQQYMKRHIKQEEHILAKCMNDFGFPWISDDYYEFWDDTDLKKYIYSMEMVDSLRDAFLVDVQIFMMEKFINHIKTWRDGMLNKNNLIDFSGAYIQSTISEELRKIFRAFYTFNGLSGIVFCRKQFEEYINNKFFNQLYSYFHETIQKKDFNTIMSLDAISNRRWEDGNPGDNPLENFLFTSILLYMIMAEQRFLKLAKDFENDFHKESGWPVIYCGAGGGPYVHPIRMLEIAGLLPRKSEIPLFLEMTDKLFPVLREDYFYKTLNTMQMDGHAKKAIKKDIVSEEKNIKKLLKLWQTTTEDFFNRLLIQQDIPVMMPIN